MSIQSQRLTETIRKSNLSFGDLAKMTGIPKSAVHRYASGETDKIPLDRMELLAKALNCDPAYLIGWVDSENYDDFSAGKATEIFAEAILENGKISDIIISISKMTPDEIEVVEKFISCIENSRIK